MARDVPQRLKDAAELYKERNASYGDNYRRFGPVLRAMFPDGLTVGTEAEWTRLCLLVHMVTKVTRYSCCFERGGHQDSLEDLSVYAAMTALTDEEEREYMLRELCPPDPSAVPEPQTALVPERQPDGSVSMGHGDEVYIDVPNLSPSVSMDEYLRQEWAVGPRETVARTMGSERMVPRHEEEGEDGQ